MARGEPAGPLPQASDSLRGLSRGRLVATLAGLMLGLLVVALNQTVVSTAMPRILADLRGLDRYSWVFTAYMLTSTTAVPIVGRLSDIYGRKGLFLLGLVVFMLGSILCGLAQGMNQLIAFRGLQGLGAASVMAIVFIVVGDLFPPAQRARYQGIFSAVWGVAGVLGPVTGGYITDHLSWRWVFFVNLPVGLLSLLVLALAMPAYRWAGARRRIDYAGAMVLTLAVVSLLLALTWAGGREGWTSSRVLGLFLFSGLATLAFLSLEARALEPVIPLSLFRSSIFNIAVSVSLLTSMAVFGAQIFLPLFIQAVIGASATNSGAVLIPMMISMPLGSILGGQVMSRWGRYRYLSLASLGIVTLGMFLLSRMGTDTSYAEAVRNMVILGFGMGVSFPLFTIVVQNAMPPGQISIVTSSIQFFRSMGGTVGIAVLGSLLTYRLGSQLAAMPSQGLPPDLVARMQNPEVLLSPGALEQVRQQMANLGPQAQEQMPGMLLFQKQALASSLNLVFLAGVIIVALSLAAAFFLREIPLRKTHLPPEAAARPASGPALDAEGSPGPGDHHRGD